jgi:hypothetical protein
VLDKGLVIAGDITLYLGSVQLLTLKIRLLIASVDKAQEIGIDWWRADPALSSRASARAKDLEHSEQERDLLKKRLDRLERLLLPPTQEANQERAAAGQRSNAASAYVLEDNGMASAKRKQPLHPAEQPQGDEGSQVQERAPQPEAAQAEQPAGAGPLLDPALHERIAQAMRPVVEGLPHWIAQAWQPGEQARPEEERGKEQQQTART